MVAETGSWSDTELELESSSDSNMEVSNLYVTTLTSQHR